MISLVHSSNDETVKQPFEDVFEEQYKYVYNFVYMKILNKEEAEDIVSDTFMKAYTHYDDFDPKKAKIATWLCTIAKNTLTDKMRSRMSHPMVPEEEAPESSSTDEYDVFDDPMKQEVSWLLAQLSDNERELIAMRYQMDMSNEEIGKVLGIAPKAVSERFRRALKKCREIEAAAGHDFADMLE